MREEVSCVVALLSVVSILENTRNGWVEMCTHLGGRGL